MDMLVTKVAELGRQDRPELNALMREMLPAYIVERTRRASCNRDVCTFVQLILLAGLPCRPAERLRSWQTWRARRDSNPSLLIRRSMPSVQSVRQNPYPQARIH
jgi:hypothetical protein